MNAENRQRFFEYAQTKMPREACALLIIEKGRERLIECENKSILQDQFLISSQDFARAEARGEIVGVVHSHVYKPARPSESDLVSCEGSNLPWFICSVPTGAWFDFKPSGYKAPLVGRTWAHGNLDCFALVRDYYREELQIEVPDFDREFEWWDKGHELFCASNLEKAGFYEVPLSEIKKHDGLIMQIHSSVPNHSGVYLGDDVFLHQLAKRLSSRDVFAGYYRKHTVKVVRHKASK